MNGECCEGQPDSGQIRTQLSKLEEGIEITTNLNDRLAGRLSPVMNPPVSLSTGTASDKMPPAPSESDIASRLRRCVTQISELGDSIRRCTDQLDI